MTKHNTNMELKDKKCKKCKRNLPPTLDYFRSHKGYKDGMESTCKECRGVSFTRYLEVKEGHKECNKCKRELPADTDHFTPSKRHWRGVSGTCKECQGKSFTDFLSIKKGFKRCTKCKREFPATLEYFHKNTGAEANSDGLYARCKGCKNAETKEYALRNKERLRKYARRHYHENKDRYREARKVWGEKNRDVLNVIYQRRVARVNKLPNTLTTEEWIETKKYFGYECSYCGIPEGKLKEIKEVRNILEQEHVIPVKEGGGYTKENIIPACSSCNSSKRAKDFLEWYPTQPFYDIEKEKKILHFTKTVG